MLAVVAVIMAALRWTGFMEAVAFVHPRTKSFATPPAFEDVYITTADGVRLHAWFMPARRPPGSPPGPAVLHVHGNEGAVNVHAEWSHFLTERGISVLLFDYRSFGRSEYDGKYLTRKDLLRDARAALDALLARPDVDRARVGVYGVSLGGSFALALGAERPEVASICTLATFSSWPGVANDYAPVLGSLLIQTGMAQADNATRLGTRPLLIVHGDRDEIVRVRHAPIIENAARAAGVPVETIIVPGADHLDVLDDRFGTHTRIADFFARTLRADTPAPAAAVPASAGPSTR